MTASVIDHVVFRQVRVPLDPPLQSASGQVREMPMVLVDVTDQDGVTGSSYLLCYAPPAAAAAYVFAKGVAEAIVGGPAAPRSAAEALTRRLRLLGKSGVAAWVLGGLDLALWDLAARRASMSLARLLGAEPIAIPAYASLRSADPNRIAAEAAQAASAGFIAFKVKIGHGPVERDLAAIDAVREGAGHDAIVMVDYNQSLTVPDAIARAGKLTDAGVAWIEEPVSADDPVGHARVAETSPIPIQIGENWQGLREVGRNVACFASDLAMLDAMNIGGVTGWLAAAALANSASLPVSSHLFCEVSAHLLAATPDRHWLEWLDVAGPILLRPLVPIGGTVTACDLPGSGIEWDEDAILRYAI